MKKRLLLTMAVVLAGQAACASRIVPVRTKVDRVILRLEPSFKAAAVGYADMGQILQKSGSEGSWLQILPPPDVFVWVPREQVTDGLVAGAKIRARSGPGMDYPVVDELLRGEKVDVEAVERDWVKIRPPKGRILWVHKTLVEPAPDVKLEEPEDEDRERGKKEPSQPAPIRKKRAEPTVPEPGEADSGAVNTPPVPAEPGRAKGVGLTEAEVGKIDAPAAIVAVGLVRHEGQGAVVKYEGILRARALFSRSPARFRLLTQGRGAKTICFVAGNRKQFAEYVGMRITTGGKQYWVKQCDVPVLVPQWVNTVGDEAGRNE